MKPAPFAYQRPGSLQDAIRTFAAQAEGRLMAGGQSLGPLLNLRLAQPKHVVDISRLEELRSATMEGDILAIGACVTHAEIEDGRIPDVTAGLMPHIASGIAYRAVRNRGTIGGSLAHADPAADWLTTMIALDAKLRLAGAGGSRQIRVSDFPTGALSTAIEDDEIITHVLVTRLSPDARWGHAKYAKKLGDFAQSMAVAVVDSARGPARVVLGRRSELPTLLDEVSGLLTAQGHDPSRDALTKAMEADLAEAQVDPGDYTMHRAIVARAVLDLKA